MKYPILTKNKISICAKFEHINQHNYRVYKMNAESKKVHTHTQNPAKSQIIQVEIHFEFFTGLSSIFP
jgi:hypothetical protein